MGVEAEVAVACDRTWLVGLMASGKSTVGRRLAARLGDGSAPAPDGTGGGHIETAPVEYVDNDATVGAMAGRSTLLLAAEGGEILHDWEARYVAQIVQLAPPVVAGIPASTADRPSELAALRSSGLLVYLRVDVATLLSRIAHGAPRPWLTEGVDVAGTVEEMFARRDPLLRREASAVVDATATVAAVVAAVTAARSAHLSVTRHG